MAVDRAALHAFVTGSPALGQYPSAQWGQWDGWRKALLTECRERGVTVHLTGSTATQSHAKVPTLLADVGAQCGERWPDTSRTDGMSWSLEEAIEQVRLCSLALDAADAAQSGAGGSGGAVGALPPGTAQGKLTWAADLSKADVLAAGYASTPWNTEHGPAWPPPIVMGPGGKRAIQFALGSGGKRIEVQPPDKVNSFGKGLDAWFGFAFYLDAKFPLTAGSWQVLWQLHGDDTTSPRQCLQVHKGGLTIADNHRIADLSTGRWYRAVVHASTDPKGLMSVWLDGTQVCDGYAAGLNATPLYLKMGWYHDTAIPGGLMYQRDHKLGTGYGAVCPS